MNAFLFAMLLAAAPPYDLVVKGGRVVDGTGNPSYLGDLVIRAGRIVAVGKLPEA
jgi:N-acyl-D-aspartate/D-glutamate deacylase